VERSSYAPADVLPSNEHAPHLQRRGDRGPRLVGLLRLALVLAVLLAAIALGAQHAETLAPGLQPLLATLAQGGRLALQAAVEQLARRSRMPVSTTVDLGRLLVLAVFVSGLFWFARSRMR
jgi:hypothetical protein